MDNTTDSSTPNGKWKCPNSLCNEENPGILVFCNKCGVAQLSEWQWSKDNRKDVRKYFKALLEKEEWTREMAGQAGDSSEKAGNKSPTQEDRDPSATPDAAAEMATPSQEDPTTASKSDVPGSGGAYGGDVSSEVEVEIIDANNQESSK